MYKVILGLFIVAALATGAEAQLTSPAPGVLSGSSVTFTWSSGGTGQYYLNVGNTLNGVDYFNAAVGGALSQTVSGLPTDGRTIYVRIWTKFSTWTFTDYVFTAYTPSSGGGGGGSTGTPGPWICHGDTLIATGTVIDPAVGAAGVIGECAGLPYTVPTGYTLWLTTVILESHVALPGMIVICPWVGPVSLSPKQEWLLPCVQTGLGVPTTQIDYFPPIGVPAGSMVHALFQSSQVSTYHSWLIQGKLVKN